MLKANSFASQTRPVGTAIKLPPQTEPPARLAVLGQYASPREGRVWEGFWDRIKLEALWIQKDL